MTSVTYQTNELRDACFARIKHFQDSWEIEQISSKVDRSNDSEDEHLYEVDGKKWSSNWFGELGILTHRNLKDVLRDKATIGATVGQAVIMTIIMG